MPRSKQIPIAIQFATSRRGVPHPQSLRKWAQAAAFGSPGPGLTIRIVSALEGRQLNRRWRGKDEPTNVLSFPSSSPRSYSLEPSASFLGDIVICAPVVAHEAREQRKPLREHWAHMVVHGVLHLQGFDHVNNRDAKRMEAREIEILCGFGHPNPYLGSACP